MSSGLILAAPVRIEYIIRDQNPRHREAGVVIGYLRVHVIPMGLPSSFVSACFESFSLDCKIFGFRFSCEFSIILS